MKKAITISENKIKRVDDIESEKQECFNYITNKLWSGKRKIEFEDPSKPIYLYKDNKSDTFYCFLENEIPTINDPKGKKLTLIRKFDESECKIEGTYHNECDPIFTISSIQEVMLYSMFMEPKKFSSPPFPQWSHKNYTYYPIPIFIFSPGKIDFFNKSINPVITLSQLFDILCLFSKPKKIVEKCKTKRENFKYACLSKLNKGDPDEGHNYPVKLLDWILKINIFNEFNFNDVGTGLIHFKRFLDSKAKDKRILNFLSKKDLDIVLDFIDTLNEKISDNYNIYQIQFDPVLHDMLIEAENSLMDYESNLYNKGYNEGKDFGYTLGYYKGQEDCE